MKKLILFFEHLIDGIDDVYIKLYAHQIFLKNIPKLSRKSNFKSGTIIDRPMDSSASKNAKIRPNFDFWGQISGYFHTLSLSTSIILSLKWLWVWKWQR